MFLAAPDVPERRAGELRVHFVDVGQGDCTIFEFPDGKTMIVDAGDASVASRRAVIAYAHALGIDAFDVLLLTHPDSDHAGGMADVIECYGAGQIWMPYCLNTAVNERVCRVCGGGVRRAARPCSISQMYRHLLSEDADHFYYAMLLAPALPGDRGQRLYGAERRAGGGGGASTTLRDPVRRVRRPPPASHGRRVDARSRKRWSRTIR